MEKITYASLGSLGESFHHSFEEAALRVRSQLGQSHPMWINGRSVTSRSNFPDRSPAHTRLVLGRFAKGSAAQLREAIEGARKAFPAWRDLGWRQRIVLLRKAADLINQRQFELAAVLTLEVGKNRFEAIAEVSETADLITYYCDQLEKNGGYEIPMSLSASETTRSVLKPYGVWGVVSPFNFPMALAGGMAAGALVTGNTVVFKPASDTPFSGLKIAEIFRDAGLPTGVFHFITGGGGTLGREFLQNPNLDGLIFTGSRDVGLSLLHEFGQKRPRPCITEMGGKNPAVIMPSANLHHAVEGVYRSAFGMGGQKCSACSRLYVHRAIHKAFMEMLVAKTESCPIGDPLDRETFLGPLINEHAVDVYEHAVRQGKREGRVAYGGHVLKRDGFERGYFVEPTIIDRIPKSSSLFQDEFFAPVLAVAEVGSLEEAVRLANDSDYGLTAGIFTEDPAERDQFFRDVEAGVLYCNRRGGATTGAWPGVQSFGGWKCSGSSGKSALGPHYVTQFMREQSQTVIH